VKTSLDTSPYDGNENKIAFNKKNKKYYYFYIFAPYATIQGWQLHQAS